MKNRQGALTWCNCQLCDSHSSLALNCNHEDTELCRSLLMMFVNSFIFMMHNSVIVEKTSLLLCFSVVLMMKFPSNMWWLDLGFWLVSICPTLITSDHRLRDIKSLLTPTWSVQCQSRVLSAYMIATWAHMLQPFWATPNHPSKSCVHAVSNLISNFWTVSQWSSMLKLRILLLSSWFQLGNSLLLVY